MNVSNANLIKTTAAAVTAAVVLTVSGMASAADLGGGPRQPPQEPYSYVSPLDTARWSGAYLGLNYGYATGQSAVTGDSGLFSLDQSGGVGGVYGGYNWQLGNIVLGLEAELGTGNYDGTTGSGAGLVSSQMNTLAGVRARAGVLLSPAFLVYATGGFAWADMDFTANNITQTNWISGYQIGAGTELNVAGPWTLRLEYIYTGLDTQTFSQGGVTNTYDPDFHTIRAGLSFKF